MLTTFKREESPYYYIRGTVRVGRKIITIKESTGRIKKIDAEKVRAEREREILLGIEQENNMTWSQCLEKMQDNPKHCPAPYRMSIFKKVENVIGHHYLDEFNDDLVFKYIYEFYPVLNKWKGTDFKKLEYEDKHEASSKYSTANNFISVISKVVHYGFKQGYCKDPTFELFPVLNARQRKKEKFTIEEVRKIEKNCDDFDVVFLFVFLIYTGVRIGEALYMNWKRTNPENDDRPMIDLEKNEFNIRLHKTNEWITKPIHDKIHEYLKKINYRDGNLFEWHDQNKDRPTSPNGLKMRWREMLKQCGIKYKNRHACRHTHASWISDSGANIQEIMTSVGWKSSKIALGYIKSDKDKINKLVTDLPV
jgi:integrase|tara:strand:+ start:1004 stop:2098 length:1095 start_codon:yes stop_codon:yes gene_type:complete